MRIVDVLLAIPGLLLSALGFVLISFAVDLVTPLIDPRQRNVARATAPRALQEAPA